METLGIPIHCGFSWNMDIVYSYEFIVIQLVLQLNPWMQLYYSILGYSLLLLVLRMCLQVQITVMSWMQISWFSCLYDNFRSQGNCLCQISCFVAILLCAIFMIMKIVDLAMNNVLGLMKCDFTTLAPGMSCALCCKTVTPFCCKEKYSRLIFSFQG